MKFETDNIKIFNEMIMLAIQNGIGFQAEYFKHVYVINYTGGY